MDLASTDCTSQIKAEFYLIYSFFIILHPETDGEHRTTSQKGFISSQKQDISS
jgi:hypothetical protein